MNSTNQKVAAWIRPITCALLIATTGTTSCSTKKEEAVIPKTTLGGKRYLLTPADGKQLLYYAAASAVGIDQPAWVINNYTAPGGTFLFARVDTAGTVTGSRTISYPSAFNSEILGLAALDNGRCVGLGQENGAAFIFQLATDGTTGWSKSLQLNNGTVQNFNPVGLASVGNGVLACSSGGNINQRIFIPVASDGTVGAGTGYMLPQAQVSGFIGNTPKIKSLPNSGGVVVLEQLDRTKYLLSSVDGAGQLRWIKRLDLAGLPTSTSLVSFDLAVSPATGNLAVLVSFSSDKISQLVRLSGAGDVLSATNYSVAANVGLRYGRLALGPQDEAAWTVESFSWLYYYQIGAQGQVVAAKQVAAAPKYTGSVVLGAYGLVSVGRKGAYAFGSLAGPAPTNYSNTSINFLHLNAAGQAGCEVADAPTLTSAPITGTLATTLATPTVITVPVTAAGYTLSNVAATLNVTTACQ